MNSEPTYREELDALYAQIDASLASIERNTGRLWWVLGISLLTMGILVLGWLGIQP